MAFRIVLTKPAIADFESLVKYIRRDNPRAAESMVTSISERIEYLAEFPFFGRIVPEFKSEIIREIIHAPYRIVYRIKDGAQLIEVLRIWHAARGTPRI